MVEVGGRPILWHIMKNLAHYGITDFIVATGYKSDMIKEYFLNYEAWNNDFTIRLGHRNSLIFHDVHDEAQWTVTVAFTGDSTMTGGRVFRASRYLDDDAFLVTYGDGLADVNINDLREHHSRSGCLATVTTVQPFSRFGVMDVDDNGKVIAFSEKPRLEGWINVGFFIMEPEVIKYLDPDCVLEEEPLARLAADQQLSAYRHRGFWQPMDTYREAKMLNDMWDSGEPPWRLW
jgi:glucose-1-phosphate cytidylyltransferase